MTTTYPEAPADPAPFLDEWWTLVPDDEEVFISEPDDDTEVDPGPWDVYADVAEQYGL